MSVAVNLSERQVKAAIVKLAISLVGAFALLTWGLALLTGHGQSTALNFLFVTFAFSFLANGVLAVLKIIDWFEKRNRGNG